MDVTDIADIGVRAALDAPLWCVLDGGIGGAGGILVPGGRNALGFEGRETRSGRNEPMLCGATPVSTSGSLGDGKRGSACTALLSTA